MLYKIFNAASISHVQVTRRNIFGNAKLNKTNISDLKLAAGSLTKIDLSFGFRIRCYPPNVFVHLRSHPYY
jgi:hypothetical protein